MAATAPAFDDDCPWKLLDDGRTLIGAIQASPAFHAKRGVSDGPADPGFAFYGCDHEDPGLIAARREINEAAGRQLGRPIKASPARLRMYSTGSPGPWVKATAVFVANREGAEPTVRPVEVVESYSPEGFTWADLDTGLNRMLKAEHAVTLAAETKDGWGVGQSVDLTHSSKHFAEVEKRCRARWKEVLEHSKR